MKIIKLEKSPIKNKRLRVFLDNGDKYDFGLDGGHTYIEHNDKTKRRNYFQRHMGNATENTRICRLIPSAALFSAFILWGRHKSIAANTKELNHLWKHPEKASAIIASIMNYV